MKSKNRKVACILCVLLFSCSEDKPKTTPIVTETPEALSVVAVAPKNGPVSGGVPALLTGSGFKDGLSIAIGSKTVQDPSVGSSKAVSFLVPASEIGAKDIRVTNPDGETVILKNGFTYVPEGLLVTMGFILPSKDNISGRPTLADFDGDGNLDIFMGNFRKNDLLMNMGGANFEDKAVEILGETDAGTDMTTDAKFGLLNDDEYLDMVVTNDSLGLSKIYFGQEGFTGVTTTILQPRGCSKAADLGDVDGDGDLDILIVNFYSTDCRQVSRLYLNDSGVFTDVTGENFPKRLGGQYTSVDGKFVDVDGDGSLDIIFANLAGLDTLYINNGDATFRDASSSLGLGPLDSTGVDAGDVDNDGDTDILIFTLDEDILLLNQGDSTFVKSTGLPEHTDVTWDGRLIDLDNDEDLDIVKINHGQNVIYLNNGAGKFYVAAGNGMPIANAEGKGMDIGDLNSDGFLDIIIANGSTAGQQNRVYFGNGQALFFDATGNFPVDVGDTSDIVLGDIDKDGIDDMLLADYLGAMRVFLGGENRTFAEVLNVFNSDENATFEGLVLFDMDGDEDLDVFAALGENATDRLFENKSEVGKIVFEDVTDARLASHAVGNSRGAQAADIDGDKDIDIVVARLGRESIWINDGSGNFIDEADARLPAEAEGNTSTASVLLADVDGDGFVDILLSNNNLSGLDTNKQNRLYLNRGILGKGIFDDVTSTNLPSASDDDTMQMVAADIDGDNDLDLAVANDDFGNSCRNRLYLNDGFGIFSDVTALQMTPDCDGSKGVVFVDIEGDNDIDVLFANRGQDRLYLNDGDGYLTIDAVQSIPRETDDANKVKIVDLDNDGDFDIVYAINGQSKINVNVTN